MIRCWIWDRRVPGSNPARTIVISLSKKIAPHCILLTRCVRGYCEGISLSHHDSLEDHLLCTLIRAGYWLLNQWPGVKFEETDIKPNFNLKKYSPSRVVTGWLEIHVDKVDFYNFVDVTDKWVQYAVKIRVVLWVIRGMKVALRQTVTLEYSTLTRWNKQKGHK